jgi:putative DNA methylase
MSRPKLLIEQWLPIETIGAECMRDASAAKKPPLNRLHVWWARRPLTVSRAAILASLLPAYPTEDDPDARPFPDRFVSLFPSFDAYKAWFLRLIGILGDPVAGRKLIEWAKKENKKLKFNPYGYPRAFTVNPSEEQLEQLYDLLEWTWGTREITFCDPMAGGGSIPFEALRYGLTVHANELNPVACVILKATLDYPARFGPSLVEDIRKYGKIWCERVRQRLEPFFPLAEPDENIFCYLWARTVACPETGKLVPLSPNWWLRKGSDPIAVKVIADPNADRCRFEIVRGAAACKKANPDRGTVKRGTGISPWTGGTIDGDYIKAEAQAGRMGQQLYAVGIKKPGDFSFRAPTEEDEKAVQRAEHELKKRWAEWEAKGLIPTERYPTPSTDMRPVLYGMPTWADFFSPRQLLAILVMLEELTVISHECQSQVSDPVAVGGLTYLSVVLDKATDYSSRLVRWDGTRNKICNTFDRHDFSFKYSHAEFDASRNQLPWAVDQVADAYAGISSLTASATATRSLFPNTSSPVERLNVRRGMAQDLRTLDSSSIHLICVDPPYYDNVQYAECSDFFFVWLKRSAGQLHPDLFNALELTPKDEEAVANPARFSDSRRRRELAEADYEYKMRASFREMVTVHTRKSRWR